ncbi:Arc/MetJ-type ribon-helix-helix transcriptional regulator [Limimaricola variabilis]|uniref:Arc/MetJ-type ribon-helix-helix transcriptional regulator n=1 Tax=Limimaricola variabilis TaxID=1492771 RepID=A0ABR6HN55_9RHOB|nr:CopG family transcriptional regulator [Limimaricola variabilis]MBB3711836.1 Arc/MetJ-type ribon-helix-helix transcriptional regulator [Limimaricola variabilis]
MAKRDKTAETEKITINLGPVDLGRIDLLVQEGFFTNRTDFIRTAIRTQLAAQSNDIDRSVARHQLEMGLYDFLRADLEALRDRGEMLHIRVVGLARFASDIDPDLARQTIASLTVLGALQASPALKTALADRMT